MNATVPRFFGVIAVVSVVLNTSAQANAPAGRYTYPAAGTVYDTKTKLSWQQTAPSETYTWADAKTYCQGLSLAGTGWRLPTMKELQTIIDYSQSVAPLIDPTAFPSTVAAYFWSSSPVAGSPSSAWYVLFNTGVTPYNDVTNHNDVRCVR